MKNCSICPTSISGGEKREHGGTETFEEVMSEFSRADERHSSADNPKSISKTIP